VEAELSRRALSATCHIEVFTDGAAMIESISRQALPDVLVLDWVMPELSGIEVCQFLRRNPPTASLPILFLTSNQHPDDVAQGLAAGANDYVFKPFNPVELAARVQAQVRWQHLRLQAQREELEAHDITRRTLVEARARADFERQLIGIVSHDLRTPLSAITLAASVLLKRDDLNEKQAKNATRILDSAERATRMVRDLLDFTQARLQGGLALERKAANLHELARGVVEEVHSTTPQRHIEVVQEGDGGGMWDPDRVCQVISNLLTNALHYSPASTPVRLETREVGEEILLTVHNWGTPIPPFVFARIFEPLERGIQQEDRAGRSIGLGLFIVKHIVSAHGGTIDVRSGEREGTTFTVRLPKQSAETPG
jgi:signal transduction histidine kinase